MKKPRRGRRKLRIGCLALLASVAVVFCGYAAYLRVSWPDVEALRTENPTSSAFIELCERDTGERVTLNWVAWERIDGELKYAVIVAEDSEFLDHDGYSSHEIREAIRTAIRKGRAPRGASTITQQLAKNLWLTPSRNPLRKFREAILTRQLERHLSKRRILEIYLNVAEFGPGVYGVGAATRHYYGRSPQRLSRHQAAMLAASLPRPSTWHPGVDWPGYKRYVETILGRMDRFEGLRERVGGL